MKSIYYLMYVMCFSLALGACSDDISSSENDDSDDDEAGISVLSQVAGLSADDDPAAISEELEEDIEDIFGEADDKATDVLANDTVQTVINRARSDEDESD